MSILRRHAKPDAKTLTERYNTRVSKEVADELEKWCKKFNLTPSEAIRLLIEEELKRLRLETETREDNNTPVASSSHTYASNRRQSSSRPRRSTGSRFSSAPWRVGNQLPCPICKSWSAAANFKRDHIDPHGYESSEDFFTRLKEQCNQMVEERKEY